MRHQGIRSHHADAAAVAATVKSLNMIFHCGVHTTSGVACGAADGRHGKISTESCGDSVARRTTPKWQVRRLTSFFLETFLLGPRSKGQCSALRAVNRKADHPMSRDGNEEMVKLYKADHHKPI